MVFRTDVYGGLWEDAARSLHLNAEFCICDPSKYGEILGLTEEELSAYGDSSENVEDSEPGKNSVQFPKTLPPAEELS